MNADRHEFTATEKLQRLYELASDQAGYFTATQARALGYSPRALVHHVAAGHFERIQRGFYRLVGVPVSPHEDIVAAWVRYRARSAVVSHDTALTLYDLAPTRSHAIHLTVPRARRLRAPQPEPHIVVHTTLTPLRREEVVHRYGAQVTAPARTIVDVADIGVDPHVVIEATATSLRSGLVSPDELRTAAHGRAVRVRQLVERALEEAGAHA
jgi:predicted transcriptional regulator of viral defense system